MKTIKCNKQELLSKLKDNRAKHRAVFLEAQDEYRKLVIAELEAMLQDARDNKRIRRSVSLIEPIDQTREYDTAIGMLDMHRAEFIEISDREYRCYVLDQWDWIEQFKFANARYSKTLQDEE